MDELLKQLDLAEIKPYLEKAEIKFESLKYLTKGDIKEAVPPIGLRACFREKLFGWRKRELGIDDDTLSEPTASKVDSWLQNSSTGTTSTPTSSISKPFGKSKLSKNLKLVLQDSLKGKFIISYYEKNRSLTEFLRTDLISIIIEDVFYHDVKMSPRDFPAIVDEIIKKLF